MVLLSTAVAAGFFLPVKAEQSESGFDYSLQEDDSAVITGWQGGQTELRIPEEIDGHPVVSVAAEAVDCSGVETLVIPESLESLETGAFYHCEALRTLDYPGSLASEHPFSDMKDLTHLHITAGSGSMADYSSGAETPWAESVFSIGWLTVDEGITRLGSYCFEGMMYVRRLNLPESLTVIGTHAMYNMARLQSLELPGGIRVLEDGAIGGDPFEWETVIDVVVPQAIQQIGKKAFDPNRRYYVYQDSLAASALPSGLFTIEMDYSLAMSSATVEIGSEQMVSLTDVPDFIARQTYFTSSDPQVLSVSPDGLIRAYRSGSATIRAECDSGFTTREITVENTAYPDVETVFVRIGVGQTVALPWEQDFPQMAKEDLNFSLSSRTLAAVDREGTLTAGDQKGRFTVQLADRQGNKAQYLVELYRPVSAISPAMTEFVMVRGYEYRLPVLISPQTADDTHVSYFSSDRHIVSVDADGSFRALRPGRADITITPRDGSPTDIVVHVTVMEDTLALDVWGLPLKTGTVFSVAGGDGDYRYYSSDESVAAVSSSGTIMALSPGRCAITVTDSAFSTATTIDVRVSDEFSAYGVDLSEWNGTLDVDDFLAMRKYGVSFVILRAGYGPDYEDSEFENNYQAARQAGMAVGAYHYITALNEDEARAEAEAMRQWLAGKRFDYPVFIDIEESEQRQLYDSQFNAIIKAYGNVLRQDGYLVGVYSYALMLEKCDAEVRSGFEIWQAHWNTTVPTVYTDPWDVWQFSSSGSFPPISGRVDCNLSLRDYPSYIQEHHYNGY